MSFVERCGNAWQTGLLLLGFVVGGALLAAEQPVIPEPPALEPAPAFRIEVEPCKTRVMIASVYLTIGDLTIEDGHLVGSYAIQVPLKTEKNETGTILLPLPTNPDQAFGEGGRLQGEGQSHIRPEDQRLITCVFFPDETQMAGEVTRTIELEERTLEFSSRYVKHGDFALALAADAASSPEVAHNPAG